MPAKGGSAPYNSKKTSAVFLTPRRFWQKVDPGTAKSYPLFFDIDHADPAVGRAGMSKVEKEVGLQRVAWAY